MSNTYDLDTHIAEIYDQSETYTDDVDLLRTLIGPDARWRILEPFCGTGRILLPLAQDGHTVDGIDSSAGMLAQAQMKISRLPDDVQQRITLRQGDALTDDWGSGYDLVILGGNCLYEFGTAEEQCRVIQRAAASVRAGGYLYVDNNARSDHFPPYVPLGVERDGAFPTGTCADGTRLEASGTLLHEDDQRHCRRYRKTIKVIDPHGVVTQYDRDTSTHFVSMEDVCVWLHDAGCRVMHLYGHRHGEPFTPATSRAVFWALR